MLDVVRAGRLSAARRRATVRAGRAERRRRARGVRRDRARGRTTRSAATSHAIATAPVNKEAFRLAGLPWSGHTDLLAHLTGAPHVAMMFYSEALRVVLATVHIAAGRRAARADAGVARGDDRADGARAAAIRRSRRRGSRVAGLNPHAGEHGLFGREEETVDRAGDRRPAARAASTSSGPFPADTVFVRARRGEFDVVVACYHDQGLIPVKLLAFGQAVNVTLGLPIVRTSVDHGTAFDIAGKGVADPESMIAAVLLAARLAQSRRARPVALRRATLSTMAEKTEREKAQANIAENRKAFHDYHLLETFEAGIVLLGTEVKAIREGRVNLRDSFARVEDGEVFLYNVNISPYSHRGYADHEPLRRRKLLLHRDEIRKLIGKTVEKGMTLVPVRMYFKNGRVKVAVSLAKGKKEYDKRETIKRRETDRETRAAIKSTPVGIVRSECPP